MLDIKRLTSFYYTVKLGNQQKAANYLGITQSTIASNIKNLEKDLDSCLFKGRNFLSYEGQELFDELSNYLPSLEEAEQRIRQKRINYQPHIIIGSTVGMCGDWLNSFIPHFLDQEEKIQVIVKTFHLGKELKKAFDTCDVIISDSFYNHLERKKLYTFSFGLYASKHYIEKYGLPTKPEDLDHHRLIEYVSDDENPFAHVEGMLHVNSPRNRRRSVITDSSIGEARLVNEGAGIGCVSLESQSIDVDNVVPIDIGVPDIHVDMYYYYKKNSPRANPLILKFYDIIMETIKRKKA